MSDRLALISLLLPGLCGGQNLSDTYYADIPKPGDVYTRETATRLTVCLNGQWQFQPAVGERSKPPAEGWGTLSVPGLWNVQWQSPVRGPGNKPPNTWPLRKAVLGWFRRVVEVPETPGAKRCLIELCQITGWARVFADDALAGELEWGGRVDVTEHLRGKKRVTLSVLVAAKRPGTRAHTIFDGPVAAGTGRSERGIVGDVFLHLLPGGPVVEHARIITSVRNSTWTAHCDLSRLAPDSRYRLSVEALGRDGRAAATMQRSFAADGSATSVEVQSSWLAPRLWELTDPHLYTCVVRLAHGNGELLDEHRTSFGFREIRLDREQFILNGRRIRLRPNLYYGAWFLMPSMCPVLMRAQLAGFKRDGFNTVQYWPGAFRSALVHLASEADRLGMLLIMPLESMVRAVGAFRAGKPPAQWRRKVERQVRLLGNHPSIVIWGVCPNTFGHALPPFLTRDRQPPYSYLKAKREGARVAMRAYKEIDPTRPILFHASDVGEVVGLNMYLNLMPVQEQKDFLEVWASEKDYPLAMVECGIPYYGTAMRYRRVGFPPYQCAPFVTELAAAYLGREAYALERDEYVENTAQMFRGNEAYHSWHAGKEPTVEPNFTPVSALFVKERWRSWRTWGITGGMIPWEYYLHAFDTGQRHQPYDNKDVAVGARSHPGCWPRGIRRGQLVPWTMPDDPNATIRYAKERRAAGSAFREVNQALLVYVGGPDDDHTSLAHNFRAGGDLTRDVIAIYDGDDPAGITMELSWTVTFGAHTIASDRAVLKMGCGDEQRVPIRLRLPTAEERTEGAITLSVDGRPADTYHFTAFPPTAAPSLRRQIKVFDPKGLTSRMLRRLGIPFGQFSAAPSSKEILVIGRDALSEGRFIAADLPRAVESGLRVVLLAQNPSFWEQRMGWRTAWHVARRFWFSQGAAALFDGIRESDLRDWAGTGTHLPAHYDYPEEVATNFPPPQPVWHCGNRGSVASIALEKPHYGSFTPLMEGEIDLAFSPLLELRFGRGAVYLVQLDLEDQCGVDPAAEKVLAAVLQLADQNGLARPGLRVYDGDAKQCLTHLQEGGNVLVEQRSLDDLTQAAAALGLELRTETRRLRGGGTELADWPELRGVSVSDLHWRGFMDVPVITSLDGGDVAANGLLARKRVGSGTVVFCQVDPAMFPVAPLRERRQRPDEFGKDGDRENKTYFRLSRWRAARLLNQLRTNLGGSPTAADAKFLQLLCSPPPERQVLDLTGEGWLVRHGEGEKDGWFLPRCDVSDWRPASVPIKWEANTPWVKPGPCWFRRDFAVAPGFPTRGLVVRIRISTEEAVFPYLNGRELTRCRETRGSFGRERLFYVPDGLAQQNNALAVKVYNFFGGGGLQAAPVRIETAARDGLYHPDHDYDDSLYRWCPW